MSARRSNRWRAEREADALAFDLASAVWHAAPDVRAALVADLTRSSPSEDATRLLDGFARRGVIAGEAVMAGLASGLVEMEWDGRDAIVRRMLSSSPGPSSPRADDRIVLAERRLEASDEALASALRLAIRHRYHVWFAGRPDTGPISYGWLAI